MSVAQHLHQAPLTKDELAALVARDIPPGSYVNLGIGLPTAVNHYLRPEQGVVLHTENGMLGMGPEAEPDAVVRLAHQQPRRVRARAAAGEERDRLWRRWAEIDVGLDAYARSRSTETPVVVLEPSARVPEDT